jgi:D-alanyl-lipoteichoic acid acyltransferase DltB (MBOAT superfamily)
MGFELMLNFRLPYFSLSPSDFWSRWHISLSSWLRDYLYIPLGGNRCGARRTYINLVLTMALGGLWHGAAWNFVIWGLFHGAILIAYRVLDRRKDPHEAPRPVLVGRMALMFLLVVFGWLIFRSRSLDQIAHLITHAGFSVSGDTFRLGYHLVFLCAPLVLIELWQYRRADLLAPCKLRAPLRIPLYGFLMVWVLVFGVRETMEFIYFQF